MNTKKFLYGLMALLVLIVAASCTPDSADDSEYELGIDRQDVTTNNRSIDRDDVQTSNKVSIDREDVQTSNRVSIDRDDVSVDNREN